MKNKIKIKIDGIETTFSYRNNGTPFFQFNTEGNKEGHTFKDDLRLKPKGTKFRTNGHEYEIL